MASGNGCQSTKKKYGKTEKNVGAEISTTADQQLASSPSDHFLPSHTVFLWSSRMEKIKLVLLLPAHFINKVALGFSKPMVCRFGLLLFVCLPYM